MPVNLASINLFEIIRLLIWQIESEKQLRADLISGKYWESHIDIPKPTDEQVSNRINELCQIKHL